MSQEELDLKAKKWTQFQQRKYGDKQVKTSFVDTGKQEMPPEREWHDTFLNLHICCFLE